MGSFSEFQHVLWSKHEAGSILSAHWTFGSAGLYGVRLGPVRVESDYRGG